MVLLNIMSQPFHLQTLLFALASPLYQIRALSTSYHIIPPTKASSAHSVSLKAAEEAVVSAAAVHLNTLSMQSTNKKTSFGMNMFMATVIIFKALLHR